MKIRVMESVLRYRSTDLRILNELERRLVFVEMDYLSEALRHFDYNQTPYADVQTTLDNVLDQVTSADVVTDGLERKSLRECGHKYCRIADGLIFQ